MNKSRFDSTSEDELRQRTVVGLLRSNGIRTTRHGAALYAFDSRKAYLGGDARQIDVSNWDEAEARKWLGLEDAPMVALGNGYGLKYDRGIHHTAGG